MARTPKDPKRGRGRPKGRKTPLDIGAKKNSPVSPPEPPHELDPTPPTEPPEPIPPDEVPLDDDEQLFIAEWLIDRNEYAAYHRAFPGVSYTTGRRQTRLMMARPRIRAEIRAARRAQMRRVNIHADEILDEVARIALSDIYGLFDPNTGLLRSPRHIPYDTRKAIASISVSRERTTVQSNGKTRTTTRETILRYTLWNKSDALQKLANYLGLNTSIPPIEALLAMLPTELASQVRDAIRTTSAPTPVPSTNGHAKPPAEPTTP